MLTWPSTAFLLADAVLFIHLAFILFVLFGGLLALKWRSTIWLHLSTVFWGAFVEFSGWICPLTPLENWLRKQAGGKGYDRDFLGHYLEGLLYPDNLSRNTQLIFGAIVMLVNGGIYFWLWRRERLTPSSHPRP